VLPVTPAITILPVTTSKIGGSMKMPGEHPAAGALLVCPEWAVDDGRCITCRYAMARPKTNRLRCDRHDTPTTNEESCADYVPAPELAIVRDLEAKWAAKNASR
jgi:hypothetical protein